MFLNHLDEIKNKAYDFVILGSGPAGITTAISLPVSAKVLIVEAGGVDYSDPSQVYYQGKVVGDPYYDLSTDRLRQVGGTSGHWAGKCRTLDHFDFLGKDYAPTASWPIRKSDLDPYLLKATQILKINPIFSTTPYPCDVNVENLQFEFSPPVRFKAEYLERLSKSKNIDLIANTALIGAKLQDASIQEVVLANTSGGRFVLKSKCYIFAMGGIENGRMLKFVAQDNPGSALSKNKNVGAFWMEHPHATVGDYFYHYPESNRWHVGISEVQKRKLKVLNSNLHFALKVEHHEDGYVKKLLRDLLCANETVGAEVSLGLGKNYCGGLIEAAWEQEPRIENCVDLDTEVDAFGVPKVILNYQKSELDFRTIKLTSEYVAESMAKNKQAKVRLREWLWTGQYPEGDAYGGHHHMGGTRMGMSREESVVDPNSKSWDVSNLYIAGSSVFPSCGQANPTLTIVQLSIRLAEHLSAKV